MKVFNKELGEENRKASQDLDGFEEGLGSGSDLVKARSLSRDSVRSSTSNTSQEITTTAWSSIPSAGRRGRSRSRSRGRNLSGSPYFRRKASQETAVTDDSLTVAATLASNGSSAYTTSTVSNIWNALLRKDSVWDNLQPFAEDEELPPEYADNPPSGVAVFCLGSWYELKHFCRTFVSHLHIPVASLAVFGVVVGLGMLAISSMKNNVIQDRQSSAEFVARETAGYFASEFKKAFLPLYSLREAVHHSGYFDDLADKIGRYPNLIKEEGKPVDGGLANFRDVTGICDDPEVLSKWDQLVDTVNEESNLNGMVFRYRMAPKNVFCLDHKGGNAMVDGGMDTSNSDHPFWEMVTEDLFVKRWEGLHVFGPFMSPKGETFCTHLAVWNGKDNQEEWADEGGSVFELDKMRDDHINVHGTEVQNAWGFLMNYLDWGEMKRRSKMHERFSAMGMDFELNRRESDVDPEMPGPRGEPTVHYQLLAQSTESHLLDDTNSILVETESLHGVWENRVGMVDGWEPDWWPAAVACVVVVAFLLSVLTASTLVKGQLHRDLVDRMVPRAAVRKLERDQTVVDRYNLITIFYADVVGYAGAASSMSPCQIMTLLNDLYTELDKIARRHGVYKVETVGNKYMVCAGAPEVETGRGAAKRVSLFALDAMSYVDTKFLTKQGDKLFIRAGVASGPAVGGVLGKDMPRWVLFGPTVDSASAMEKTSKKSRIQCDEMTSRLLGDSDMHFVLSKRGDAPGDRAAYWIEKAAVTPQCFDLKKGSVVLDPCGHILSEKVAKGYPLKICPICCSKIEGRVTWKREGPAKYIDCGGSADFDMEAGRPDIEKTVTDPSTASHLS